MDEQIKNFLNSKRLCVFSTVMPDGTLHSAVMHFSHNEEPFEIYLSTDKTSKKAMNLNSNKGTETAIAMGFSEEKWQTFQLSGLTTIVTDPDEILEIKAVHYPKHPNSLKFESDPNTVFLKFIPQWYRYTDSKASPVVKIESK